MFYVFLVIVFFVVEKIKLIFWVDFMMGGVLVVVFKIVVVFIE